MESGWALGAADNGDSFRTGRLLAQAVGNGGSSWHPRWTNKGSRKAKCGKERIFLVVEMWLFWGP
ncbi:hypothetical protein CLIM01_14883 [Colletotrichum limetticola]|uniref:Uncharacterized protein n=1 Tax=Colletotrichum limetticola TaxID=1209924 RepID=A0ABQ9P779_9PEZI|nr:hypothetical protein CLIM01_14883 [Colletotrichum limetticola]